MPGMPRSHPEHRDASGDEQADAERQTDDRPPHDRPRGGGPEPARLAVVALMPPAGKRDAQPVDAVADQMESSREQRQRRGHGGGDDEDGPGAEAGEDRERHDEHAGEGEDHGAAAEQYRAAGRRAGARDGRVALRPAAVFLAKARHDQQRVVDAHGEAHHRDDVEREDRDVEALPEDRRQGHGDGDRDKRQPDGDERRDQRRRTRTAG